MKLLCTLFLLLSLVNLDHTAPTDSSLHYVVTTEFFTFNHESSETAEELIGMPCNDTCNEKLVNVKCNERTKICECEENYPVLLSRKNGCTKSLRLGEQCMHTESCAFNDAYSTCIQIKHNAYCQCITGYHEVLTHRSAKPYCSRDIPVLRFTKDIPALLIAISGVAVFSTLICFVLKLFIGKPQRVERPTITTRLLSTSEIAQVARSFRQPDRRTTYSRKGSRRVTVSASRATAARAAAILLVSCHLQNEGALENSSDAPGGRGSISLLQGSEQCSRKSFSAKQFKRESDMKMARNRQFCEQPSTSSLGPPASSRGSKNKQSSSLNNLIDLEAKLGEKQAHHSLSEGTIL